MKYVLDSCVAVKWAISEINSDKALILRDNAHQSVDQLIAPDLFAIEIAHALSKAERQGRISSPQSAALWMDVMATPPIMTPSILLIPGHYRSPRNIVSAFTTAYTSHWLSKRSVNC